MMKKMCNFAVQMHIENMNYKSRNIFVLAALLAFAVTVFAAPVKKTKRQLTPYSETVVKAYADSLALYKADSLMAVNDSLNAVQEKPVDGRYFRLFAPLNFYHDASSYKFLSGVQDSTINSTLMNIYMKRPDVVRYTDKELSKREAEGLGNNDVEENLKPKYFDMKSQVVRMDAASKEMEEINKKPIDLFVAKPNFWTFSGDYYLQFLQNYVTENWYKGGSNNYSMLGTVTLQYNYNNKQKVKWNNKLEMRLGFQNSESDTVNNFKAVDDLIRLTSNFGLQAHKNWYYTAQVIANTQFAQGRKNNQRKVYSDFMSPFNLNVSLGMDYTVKTNNNKLRGNVHLAPLAYNLKYVDRLDLSTSFGLEKDKHTLHDYGSQLLAELDWEPGAMFKWHTRLYAYTTYEKFQLECENTLTFKFNRYISANLFLYPRFDDSVKRKDEDSYWQFKEYLSLGFSYSM